jgi:hypothetical protein
MLAVAIWLKRPEPAVLHICSIKKRREEQAFR